MTLKRLLGKYINEFKIDGLEVGRDDQIDMQE